MYTCDFCGHVHHGVIAHASFRVSLEGTSQWIECESWEEGPQRTFWTSQPVALARVGRGAKLWPVRVRFWLQKDGSWRQSSNANALNRQATIVAWNRPELERYRSHHNSAWMGAAPAQVEVTR